ncbi:MAG: BatA and WFA domain-containing protein [Methylacidiphilales bacterium]|nr:BatA and WFA domain-containing protein [Candidatus Methylacidiphilales bacterium]
MPFLFVHPAAAWLFPAVTLPVLFHLFFRLRRQVREFPSLMFFLRIDPRLSAKRKIHEWLILLLRCLFIALLILALARPLLGLKGPGGKVARLVLIDNSGSMAAPTGAGVSKLVLAERATDKLIVASRPGDAVAVQLMIPDPTATLPRGFDASPAAVRDAVDKLTPSDGAASVPKAIRLALATLDTAKAPQRELHILTDLQRDNWSRGDLEAQSPNCRIVIHRLSSAPVTGGSISLEPLEMPARDIPAGRITPVRVALRNHGPAAAHVRLDATDDSGKNLSREVEVAPGATVPAALTFSFANPGFHWAQIWIEGDAAPTGNRTDLGFWCTDVQKVLFVGDRKDFAALPDAVSPGGTPDLSGIDSVFVSPAQVKDDLAVKPPLAVVATWDQWPQDSGVSQTLEDYVRQGGTLFLVPAPDAGVAVSRPAAAWLDADLGALQTVADTDTEPVMLLQDGDAIWHDLRDAEGRPKLGVLRAFQYRPVKPGADWQVLAASARGATLLARRNLGNGRVFASGLAFAPKWSSLPLKAGFVVLVQNAIFGDQAEHLPVRLMKAAEEFHFDFPGEDADLKSLAGSALAWQGLPRDFAGFPRAGVYEIRQRDQTNWVATSANADEASPDFLPLGPVPLLHNLPHETEALTNPDDITQTELSQASGTPLYRWLMLVALLLLLAETWLANERSSDLGRKLFSSLLPSALAGKSTPAKPGAPARV